MGVQWSEIEKVRKDYDSKRQDQRQSLSTGAMDTNEGQYMTENSGLCFDITGNCFIAPWFTMWHTYTFAFSVVIP